MRLTRIPVRRTITVLLAGNVLLLVAIPVLLGVSFADPTWLVIENLSMLVPTLACFGYAFLQGPRRAAAILLGLAMLSQAAGNVIYSSWTQYQARPPVPSPSDIAYLGFYVSVAAAVVWLARRDTGSFPRALWLDGAIGAAGAAAALAAGLSLLRSGAQGDSAAVIVGAAYTVADLLLVAMIAGLLTVRGVRGGSIWVWLAAGMAMLLRGRRRLRGARRRGHLRGRALAARPVDDRNHLHRTRDSGRRSGRVGSAPPGRGRCSRFRCWRPSPRS